MSTHGLSVLLWIGALISGQGTGLQPQAAPLLPGDPMPTIAGPALAGPRLDLPAAGSGRPALLIFSFSRSAGRDARLWNDRFSSDFPDTGPGYLVLELEAVPRLIRGMVVSSIRNGLPPPMRSRAIILDHDEAVWRRRLAVTDDGRAYVALLDPEGRIAWRNGGAFTDPDYRRMKAVLERLLQRQP